MGRTVRSYCSRTSLRSASALFDVALQSPLKTQLVGRIHIHAQMIVGQQFAIVEREDPLDNEKRPGSDALALPRNARVGCKVVDGAIDALSARQRRHVPRQQRNLDQRRIVEVLFDALGQRQIAEVKVVVVKMKAQAAQRARQFIG